MKFFKVKKATENVMYFMDSEGHKHTLTLSTEKSSEHPYRLKHSIDDKVVGLESADFESDIKQSIKHIKDTYNKKQATIQQPNKPKPTTMLPDNMQWAWDPDAADWVAVLKDNNNTTPPLYDPNNQNVVNNTTNYMSTIKSASSLSILPRLLDKVWYDYEEETAGKYAKIGSWEIGLGGYDTGYEVSYKGTPIFSITEDNKLKPYMSDDSLQKDFGFSYNDVEKALKKHRDLENIKMVNASKNNEYWAINEDFKSDDKDNRIAVLKYENEDLVDWEFFNTYEEAEKFEKEMNKKVKSSNIEYKTEEIMNYFRNKNKKVFDWFDEDNGSVIKNGDDIYIETHSFVNVPNYIYNAVQKWAFSNGYSFYSKTASKKIISKIVHTETYKDSKITVWEYDDKYSKNYGTYSYYVESDGYNSPEGSGTTNSKEDAIKEAKNYIDSYLGNKKQSSCLAKFLDGPKYSKEIKIEAGLIKNGLVKYAGFDFNRGTKYAITTKGLEVLRRASEAEHNEALNEREKLAYMFGFNTVKETTLDTTGKVIKSDELSKCEWCGEEFDESELEDTELGKVCYRCKKGIESREGPMNNKNISEAKQYLEKYLLENPELFKYQYGKDNVEEVLKELIEENPKWYKKFSSKQWNIFEADGTPLGKVTASSELDAKVKFGIEHPEYADSQSISAKEINAQYEQTTETHEPYPNPSETPHDDIVLENHDGWVNTAEQKVTPEFAQLHSILGEYKKNGHILSITQDGKDLLVSCSPIASYEMKQKFEQLGYECEETDESETGNAYDLPSYTLRIKMK